MRRLFRWVPGVACFLAFFALIGCAGQTRYHSSTVDYLYANQPPAEVERAEIAHISVPIRVGIGFVPEEGGRQNSGLLRSIWPSASASHSSMHLTEAQRVELLQEIARHFQQYPFISSIDVIPSAYLTPRGGFNNLDHLRRTYNFDTVVLVSYDQVQFTDQGFGSLLYWTIVGAYTIPAEKNTTHTMMDAVVFDVASRKMLFRAPGLNQIKGKATPVNLSEELRRDSESGYREASKELIRNLDQQLAHFRDRVKATPGQYELRYQRGYASDAGPARRPSLDN